MKKLIVIAFSLCGFFFTDNVLNAQNTGNPGNAGNAGSVGNAGNAGNAGNTATPANVLKWTKEVLPKMEQLSTKIKNIKTNNTKDARERDLYMTAIKNLVAINSKGTGLKTAEAKKHNDWFNATVNSLSIECQSHNGNICCMDCQNHGILGIWCFANCFVARFPPGID